MQYTTTELPNISIFITKIIISGRRENERDEREGSKEDRKEGDEGENGLEPKKPHN